MDNVLMPTYMTGFRCSGGECPHNCCDEPWIIAVEDRISQKYRQIQDPQLAPLFQRYIQKIDDPKITGFSRIEKLPGGKCPFQAASGYCIIQERYGTECLSGVCNTYPRHINKVNGVFEISGKISCPEVCRTALFTPEPITFQSTQSTTCIDPKAAYVFNTINFTAEPISASEILALRDFTIRILQERQCQLIDRLVFLGLFYKKVKESLQTGKNSDISGLIDNYRQTLETGGARGLTSGIAANYPLKLELILAICNIKAKNDVHYGGYFQTILAGNGYFRGTSDERVQNYSRINRDFFAGPMRSYEYILENFLVNHTFQNFLYFKSGAIDQFHAELIVHFVLVQFHLAVILGPSQEVDEATFGETFRQYSRYWEHDRNTMEKIGAFLRERSLVPLPYLTVLMKD